MSARLGRLAPAMAVGILFALVLPLSAFADSLVTVDCGDGAPLSTTADVATLTELQASIQGMIDNPSGMSCTLSQSVVVDPTLTVSASNGGNPFVVGGGRYDRGPAPGSSQGCGVNFSLNAHGSNSTGFNGEQSYTINNADGCGSFDFDGHVKATVTCLNVSVSGNVAQIKGKVTEVTGFYATLLSVGDVLESDVADNGPPHSATPDMIDAYVGDASMCVANAALADFPVENGNITVHN